MRKVLILTLLLILLCGCADTETADTTTATETTAIAESTTAATQMPETIEITSLEQLEKMGNYAVMTDTQKEAAAQFVYGTDDVDIAKYIDMFYLENTTGSRAKVDFQILGDENVKNVPRFFYEILIETEETDEKTLEKEFARFCSLTENNAVTKLSVKQIKVTFASDLGKFSDTVIKMYGMSYPFE